MNEFFLGIANATFMNYENAEGQEMDEKELLVIIPAYNEEKKYRLCIGRTGKA